MSENENVTDVSKKEKKEKKEKKKEKKEKKLIEEKFEKLDKSEKKEKKEVEKEEKKKEKKEKKEKKKEKKEKKEEKKEKKEKEKESKKTEGKEEKKDKKDKKIKEKKKKDKIKREKSKKRKLENESSEDEKEEKVQEEEKIEFKVNNLPETTQSYQAGSITENLFGTSENVNSEFYQTPIQEERKKETIEEEEKKEEKVPELSYEELKKLNDEKNARTIFIGNVPFDITQKHIEDIVKLFSSCGEVESTRVRNIPIKDTKLPRKIAIYKKEFSELKSNVNIYLVFKSVDSVESALKLNGTLFEGNHLIVDHSVEKKKTKSDYRKCIFLGNLPFDVKEDEIYSFFDKKKIKPVKVRLVRDKHNSMGKGFGFVEFTSDVDAKKAVALRGKLKIQNRIIRISHGNINAKDKKEKNQEKAKEKQDKNKTWKVVNNFSNDASESKEEKEDQGQKKRKKTNKKRDPPKKKVKK